MGAGTASGRSFIPPAASVPDEWRARLPWMWHERHAVTLPTYLDGDRRRTRAWWKGPRPRVDARHIRRVGTTCF